MVAKMAALVLMALGMAGCSKAVDDPQNLPQLGHWQKSTKLISVEVNGRSYLGDNIPNTYRKLISDRAKPSDETCTEPRVRSSDELQAMLPQKLAKDCIAESDMISPGVHTINGKCPALDGVEGMTGMSFHGTSTVTTDRIDARFNLIVTGQDRPGKAERVRIAMQQDHRRVGDCPA